MVFIFRFYCMVWLVWYSIGLLLSTHKMENLFPSAGQGQMSCNLTYILSSWSLDSFTFLVKVFKTITVMITWLVFKFFSYVILPILPLLPPFMEQVFSHFVSLVGHSLHNNSFHSSLGVSQQQVCQNHKIYINTSNWCIHIFQDWFFGKSSPNPQLLQLAFLDGSHYNGIVCLTGFNFDFKWINWNSWLDSGFKIKTVLES